MFTVKNSNRDLTDPVSLNFATWSWIVLQSGLGEAKWVAHSCRISFTAFDGFVR